MAKKKKEEKQLMSMADLGGSLDWEGGFIELFVDHGCNVDDYDIPDEMKAEIKDIVSKYKELEPRITAISDELQTAVEDSEEDENDEEE